MVATSAFGMGINKPDIRHIVRYGVPENMCSWTQELGRLVGMVFHQGLPFSTACHTQSMLVLGSRVILATYHIVPESYRNFQSHGHMIWQISHVNAEGKYCWKFLVKQCLRKKVMSYSKTAVMFASYYYRTPVLLLILVRS